MTVVVVVFTLFVYFSASHPGLVLASRVPATYSLRCFFSCCFWSSFHLFLQLMQISYMPQCQHCSAHTQYPSPPLAHIFYCAELKAAYRIPTTNCLDQPKSTHIYHMISDAFLIPKTIFCLVIKFSYAD